MGPKTRVSVCTGTTCYVMGAAECIDELEENLSVNPALANTIRLAGSTCLGHCRDAGNGGAPFVAVGETVVGRATAPAVMDEIRRRLGDGT